MEYIADADYKQAKRVWKDFEIKYLGENHDLQIQSHTVSFLNILKKYYLLMYLKVFAINVLKYMNLT